jgi:HPt (histidine-containing phosphotransfer) domain-containing protein
MTAHAMTVEKEKCLQLGMNDYVSKPIKETVLYNIIARHAQHRPENSNGAICHINLDYLHQLSGNDKEFEKQILQQFILQTPEELNRLKQAIDENDFDKIRRMAHSLKSTVGYVGLAEELNPALDRMEKKAEVEEGEKMLEDYEQVQKMCAAAIEEVQSILQCP